MPRVSSKTKSPSSPPASPPATSSAKAATPSAKADPPVVSLGPASPQPKGFRVRAYQVGFGDSFLLTFDYGSTKKHIMVDFGSVRLPDNAPNDQLAQIAKDIVNECGTDGLLGVIVTHRHRDHISGFSTDHATDPRKPWPI